MNRALSATKTRLAVNPQLQRVVWLLVCWAEWALPASSATLTNGAPVSGIITRPASITWFDGINRRYETRHQGEVRMIHVTGDQWWTAYPGCGRLVTVTSPPPPTPYPEEARRLFSRMQGTNATKLGEEMFRGFSCWKYLEESVLPTHRSDSASRMTNLFLFLANPDFPVLVRQGSPTGWNTNFDVLEIKLDCPVSPDLFACPTHLKSTRPFRIPAAPFEIELRQRRHSTQWGWATVTTNLLTSDGDTVTNRYVQFYRDVKGERQHGPKTEAKPFHQGVISCNYPMGPPYWGSVRKVGEDTILGLKADVLDCAVLGRRYWVVDHPVLGAFSIKWGMGGDTPETNEVVTLRITH